MARALDLDRYLVERAQLLTTLAAIAGRKNEFAVAFDFTDAMSVLTEEAQREVRFGQRASIRSELSVISGSELNLVSTRL